MDVKKKQVLSLTMVVSPERELKKESSEMLNGINYFFLQSGFSFNIYS
jgi:hypothetical protein